MADTYMAKLLWKNLLQKNNMTMKDAVNKYNALYPDDATSTQNLSNKLSKGSVRYHEMVDLLNAIGYEVAIKKTGDNDVSETAADADEIQTNDEYIENLVTNEKAVYVHCKDNETAKRFLVDCEFDGYLFDDGVKPTEKNTADLYRLLPDKKMCYVGAIGHIRYQANQDDIFRIEY